MYAISGKIIKVLLESLTSRVVTDFKSDVISKDVFLFLFTYISSTLAII